LFYVLGFLRAIPLVPKTHALTEVFGLGYTLFFSFMLALFLRSSKGRINWPFGSLFKPLSKSLSK